MDLDIDSVIQRQNLFTSTLKSSFLRKITKYENILLKNGIHLSEDSNGEHDNDCPRHSQSFEDQIELVLGQKSESPSARKALLKIGSRFSTLKLFRWILQVVQRTKAARILHHLDGISADELEKTILSVGSEISVAYEFQLVMLDGAVEVIKLAQHASVCMLTYLNSNEASFLPENLLQAILEIKPQNISNKDILKTRVIVHNNEPVCLKWHLSQVLKQTGLRICVETTEAQKHLREHSLLNQTQCTISQEGKPVIERKSIEPVNSQTSNDTNDDAQDTDKAEIQIERNENIDQESNNQDEIHETIQNNSEPSEEENCDTEQEEVITKPAGVRRKLHAVDMDFDKGVMLVTEHSVVASEFSAVDYDTSDFVDGGFTSVDEDLDSEIEPVPEITDEVVETVSSMCEECKEDLSIRSKGSDSINSSEISCKQDDDKRGSCCHGDNMDKGVGNSVCNIDEIMVKPSVYNEDSTGKDSDAAGHTASLYTSNNNSAIEDSDNEMCNTKNRDISAIETSDVKEKTETNKSNMDSIHGAVVNNSPLKPLSAQQTLLTDSGIKHINPSNQTDVNSSKVGCLDSNTDSDISHVNNTSRDSHIRTSENISNGNQSASQADPSYNMPGLSKNLPKDSLYKTSNNISDISQNSATDSGIYKFYGCFTPYGAKCRPEVYGFRGPLHVWNKKEKKNSLIYNDAVTVRRNHDREIERNYRDCHQSYVPKTSCCHQELV